MSLRYIHTEFPIDRGKIVNDIMIVSAIVSWRVLLLLVRRILSISTSRNLKNPILSIYRVTQCRDIFPAGTAGKYCEHGVMRYYSLAKQNLRYIADFVAILGIIARNMPMWQRDRNMAKKFVALMPYIIYIYIVLLLSWIQTRDITDHWKNVHIPYENKFIEIIKVYKNHKI